MEKIGKIKAVIIALFGLIVSIWLAANLNAGFLLFLFLFIIFCFFAFSAYIHDHLKALELGVWASLVQNTNVSANIDLYSVKGKNGDVFHEEKNKFENIVHEERIDLDILNDNTEPRRKYNDQNNMPCNIVMTCPKCRQKLYFNNDMEITECPYCGNKLNLR